MQKGFTLVEIILAVALLTVLAVMATPHLLTFKKNLDLGNNASELVEILRLAQNRAVGSNYYSQYGVLVDNNLVPNKFILFKGASYAGRDVSFDEAHNLAENFEFYDIDFGGGNEVVFDKLTGAPQAQGSISLRLKTDTSYTKTVYIYGAGAIGFETPVVPSDEGRIKDSRHLLFDYSRAIDTASESVLLTFDDKKTQVIPINVFLTGGQISWSGSVEVDGTDQAVELHTLSLNSPNTQFSIFRDGRYNNEKLEITISGDASGDLATFSADGSIVSFSSIYVSNFELQ